MRVSDDLNNNIMSISLSLSLSQTEPLLPD